MGVGLSVGALLEFAVVNFGIWRLNYSFEIRYAARSRLDPRSKRPCCRLLVGWLLLPCWHSAGSAVDCFPPATPSLPCARSYTCAQKKHKHQSIKHWVVHHAHFATVITIAARITVRLLANTHVIFTFLFDVSKPCCLHLNFGPVIWKSCHVIC